MSNTICVRLSGELSEWLAQEARTTGLSQGEIVRNYLERGKAGGATKPFMRLAGSVSGAKDLSTRKGFSRK